MFISLEISGSIINKTKKKKRETPEKLLISNDKKQKKTEANKIIIMNGMVSSFLMAYHNLWGLFNAKSILAGQ